MQKEVLKEHIEAEERATIALPYFDNTEIEFDFDPRLRTGEAIAETKERVLEVMTNFLALGPDDRLADSRHLFAYYRETYDAVGGEDWMDEEFGKIESAEAVWNHTQPHAGSIVIADGEVYVLLEVYCDWEPESSSMSWHTGNRLVRVGTFDDYPLNLPTAQDQKTDVIYDGEGEYETRA